MPLIQFHSQTFHHRARYSAKPFFDMNNLLKILLSVVASVIAFRVVTIKPIRNYLLNALLDGAVFMIKRKLK
jgi:hypothetical protein